MGALETGQFILRRSAVNGTREDNGGALGDSGMPRGLVARLYGLREGVRGEGAGGESALWDFAVCVV